MKKIAIVLFLGILLSTLSSCMAQSDEDQSDVEISIEETVTESSVLETEESLTIPERKYSEIEYAHSEDPGTNGFVRKMDKTAEEGTLFFFEQSIEPEVREACISQTLAFLSLIKETEYKIYIFEPETMIDAEIRPGAIYTHIQDFTDPDYLTQLMLAKYGNYCLYGLTYGYACYLLEIPAGNEARYMADDPSLDLNLLCFIDRFTEPDQIDNCKEIAKELVVWLIEQYGEDGFKTILQNSGELEYLDETVTLLKEFYQTKGIAFEPLQAMVRFGGYSFDYVMQTKEALFCIDRRFEDASLSYYDFPANPAIYDGFLHKDYKDVSRFIVTILQEIDILRTHFGHEVIMDDVPILFDNATGKYDGGKTNKYEIHLNMVTALLHEYVHVLSYRNMKTFPREYWCGEGYARYYEYTIPNEYFFPWYDLCFQYHVENYDETTDVVAVLCRQYLFISGKDAYSAQRDIDLFDADTVFGNYSNNDTYESGASFCKYLIEQYGEDALNAFMYPDDGEDRFDYSVFGGKTEEELVQEWKAKIEADWADLVTLEELNY